MLRPMPAIQYECVSYVDFRNTVVVPRSHPRSPDCKSRNSTAFVPCSSRTDQPDFPPIAAQAACLDRSQTIRCPAQGLSRSGHLKRHRWNYSRRFPVALASEAVLSPRPCRRKSSPKCLGNVVAKVFLSSSTARDAIWSLSYCSVTNVRSRDQLLDNNLLKSLYCLLPDRSTTKAQRSSGVLEQPEW